jgi:hypothetical protein
MRIASPELSTRCIASGLKERGEEMQLGSSLSPLSSRTELRCSMSFRKNESEEALPAFQASAGHMLNIVFPAPRNPCSQVQ